MNKRPVLHTGMKIILRDGTEGIIIDKDILSIPSNENISICFYRKNTKKWDYIDADTLKYLHDNHSLLNHKNFSIIKIFQPTYIMGVLDFLNFIKDNHYWKLIWEEK